MIRWVFVALLALNVAYFAWGVLHPPKMHRGEAALETADPGVPSLALLAERGEAPAMPADAPARPVPSPSAPAEETPITPAPPAPKGVEAVPLRQPEIVATPLPSSPAPSAPPAVAACYRLGPFPKSFLASKATVYLEELGVKVKRSGVADREQIGWWIFLPPFPSKEDAVRKTQELAYKKVEDFFIVLASEKQYAISLGVYKNKDGAERRYKEMREKGFRPSMEPRYRPTTVYWLDLREEPGTGVEEADWRALKAEYPDQELTPRPCT